MSEAILTVRLPLAWKVIFGCPCRNEGKITRLKTIVTNGVYDTNIEQPYSTYLVSIDLLE